MTFPLVEERRLHEKGDERDDENDYRREIQDLFRDYRHPWDILTELVQNAIDSINQNKDIQRGRIDIHIDSGNKSLFVRDNGIGIRATELKKVLVPKVSIDKSSGITYGYKGVGLSFVAHLAQSFTITSTRDGKRRSYGLDNCLEWVFSDAASVVERDAATIDVPGDPSGTTVEVKLCASYEVAALRTLQSLDSFFLWAKTPLILEYVLRTRTAIGNAAKYLGGTPIKEVDILVCIDGKPEQAIPYSLLTPFDGDYCKKSRYKLQTTLDKARAYEDVFLDAKLKDSDKVYRALRCDCPGLSVGTRVKTDFDLSVLICGETGVTELERQYQLTTMEEGPKKSFELGTGVYLCVNGMPTGILLHRWTDGFNKRFLCHVNVGMEANAELDKGRKGISEYTRAQIIAEIERQLGVKRVQGKYSLRHVGHRMMESLSRGYAGTDVATHLDKWDKTDDVLKEGCLRKVPLDENGVIVIFAELVGKRSLAGYQLRYISQDATFDFAFSYRVDDADLDKGPVSVSRGYIDSLDYALDDKTRLLKGRRGVDYHIGEFKISAEDIVGSEKQPLSDLDLLVVWDFNQDAIERLGGSIRDVNVDKRKFDGVTHVLGDVGGDCQVVCLKALIEKLGLTCAGAT